MTRQPNSPSQRGFFAIGAGLLLLAVFGATASAVQLAEDERTDAQSA